ncbi:MAG: c-type cytochrome [Desulfobacterales bacterium]|nr:c-type cytochrome [Desulfobacterales bacterium]
MKKVAAAAVILFVLIMGAYHVLLKVDNDFPYGRMRETPAVRPYEEPLLLMEAGTVPSAGGEAILKATAAESLHSPFGETPDIAKQGEKLYFTYCAQCHGKYHDGNGTVGQSFAPLPGDLRSAKVQSLSDGVLFKEISYGIPKGRQPPLATTIAEADRWRIILYVKSLGIRN